MTPLMAAEGAAHIADAAGTAAEGFSAMTIVSFLAFTGLVAVVTWRLTKGEKLDREDGYFLAGRNLVFPVIAGSLLLTNLSTEQLVGLNGDGFLFGLSVMAWEVMAVVSLVAMAWFFLPKFLKSGITTVPEMLDIRFGPSTRTICNLIFLVAYATILLPIVLYTGAKGMIGILGLAAATGLPETALLWIVVFAVGLIGSVYALFGGMRSVAVSDTLNGIGLLAGGFMITYFGLDLIGGGEGFMAGIHKIADLNHQGMAAGDLNRLNSIAPETTGRPPFSTLFTGVLVINMFYWCTNQQIIQRTLAARSLAEGQKGVLLTGLLKLLGPLYLVLPGIMAFYLMRQGALTVGPTIDPATGLAKLDAAGQIIPDATLAYGALVQRVLPTALTGFFAAVMMGAILSSFNSALNSTCTLFSLGFYKPFIRPGAPEAKVVASGKWFGWLIAFVSMFIAPVLAGQQSIFTYLQTMNTIYFIPIFAVVLVGLTSRYVPQRPANLALLGGVALLVLHYFVLTPLLRPEPAPGAAPADSWLPISNYHTAAIVFAALVAFMAAWGRVKPREQPWVHEYSGRVKLMDPWKYVKPAGVLLLVMVAAIYAWFADFADARRVDRGETVAITGEKAPGAGSGDAVDDGAELDLPPPLPLRPVAE